MKMKENQLKYNKSKIQIKSAGKIKYRMCIVEIKTQPYPLRQGNLQFIQPLGMYGADQDKNMLNQAQHHIKLLN